MSLTPFVPQFFQNTQKRKHQLLKAFECSRGFKRVQEGSRVFKRVQEGSMSQLPREVMGNQRGSSGVIGAK
jgi:hypothetical protein